MTGLSTSPASFTILFVCTGNICRSALAERLGRAYLNETLGDDAGMVRLHSAGTGAVIGSAMHPDSALVLQGFGGDPGDFTARQIEPEHAVDADLVLTMTRGHRRDVLQVAPRALVRTFTLREAAALLALLDDADPEGPDLPTRARALVKAMAAARFRHAAGEDDDVPDPINRPLEAHQEAGDLIAGALLPVLQRIAGLAGDDVASADPAESAGLAESVQPAGGTADDERDTARIRVAS